MGEGMESEYIDGRGGMESEYIDGRGYGE